MRRISRNTVKFKYGGKGFSRTARATTCNGRKPRRQKKPADSSKLEPPAPKAKGKGSGTSATIQSAKNTVIATAAIPTPRVATSQSSPGQCEPKLPPPLNIALQIFSTIRDRPTTWVGPASELNYTTLREFIGMHLMMYHRDGGKPHGHEKGGLIMVWHERQRRLVSSERTWSILMDEVEARTKIEMAKGLLDEERLAGLSIVLFR